MLSTSIVAAASVELSSHQQLEAPFRSYLQRSSTQLDALTLLGEFELQQRQKRGQQLYLSDARPTRLKSTVERVNEMLRASYPVQVACNSYEAHQAIDVVLHSATILSFVFDSKTGDLHRCYIDDSVSKFYKGAAVTAALISDRLLILGMENPSQTFVLFNPSRDKAKRPFLSPGNCVHAIISNPERRPQRMDLNCTNELLCVAYARRFCIFEFVVLHKPSATAAAVQTSMASAITTPVKNRRPSALLRRSSGGHLSARLELLVNSSTGDSTALLCTWHRSSASFITVVTQEIYQDHSARLQVALYELKRSTSAATLGQVHASSFNLQSKAQSCIAHSPSGNILLITEDNCLMVLRVGAHPRMEIRMVAKTGLGNQTHASRATFHPDGTFLLVFMENGDMRAFDLALQPIQFQSRLKGSHLSSSVCLTDYLEFFARVSCTSWGCDLVNSTKQSLSVVFDRGPLLLLHFKLGTRVMHGLQSHHMVADHLRLKQYDEATLLMSTIEDNQEKWNSFFLIANILLRSSDRDPVQGLSATERLLLLFKRFWSDMSAVEAAAAGGIAPENSKQKSALHSRLINRLIRLGRLEDACFTADLVGSQDGLLAIYTFSKHYGDVYLADLVRSKLSSFSNNVQQLSLTIDASHEALKVQSLSE